MSIGGGGDDPPGDCGGGEGEGGEIMDNRQCDSAERKDKLLFFG